MRVSLVFLCLNYSNINDFNVFLSTPFQSLYVCMKVMSNDALMSLNVVILVNKIQL